MDENKNLTPETEGNPNTAVNETTDTASKKAKKEKKSKKEKKPKKLKNQALLRKGGFSVAITAAALAGIILINVLVGALSKRFILEFDMSAEKENSMSEENVNYLKSLDTETEIIVCATPDEYVEGYMDYYAQNLYGVTSDATDYYKQTVTLLDKYPNHNDKITLRYVDTQGTEFNEISSRYSNEKLYYGDIIVSCTKNDSEKYKIIGFEDIYELNEDTTYAAYGYTTSSVAGSKLETAVTSAIAYVTSDKTKKAAIIKGHSSYDCTADYQTLLKNNNYEITEISDSMIGSISDEYDAIIIAAPTVDFLGTELDAISNFLENDGKLGKGLIFIADASAPYLPNLYDYLEQWGIAVEEGIMFETNSQNYIPDDPTTLGTYPTSSENDITSGMSLCITGYNVPITTSFESEGNITVTSLMSTPESVVAAPVGTAAGWTGADDYTKQSFSSVIQSQMSDYDDDNNKVSSYVFAFSSVEFISSEYIEQSSVSNKDITLAAAERAAGAENTGISFISKTITNESYADSVTAASAEVVRILFMFILPIACIAIGVYIFIRRKNA
ncbi:MAG: GldG family protein [Acutalibacteraceae bacterium]|nr:GldG family protein [Acutalibacteraceae bacterium]